MYHWSTDGRAQRRPGHQPRRHIGDLISTDTTEPAQRRPGHQPRRHSRSLAAREEARQRSTKAGASTPATLTIASRVKARMFPAQRRPGHQPRRHRSSFSRSASQLATLNEGRGINPGDTQRRGLFKSSGFPLNEGRGINPGDTRTWRDTNITTTGALNEGRGINPGDTPSCRCYPF